MKAAKRKASRRGKKRVRTQPVLDCVTRALIENGIPLTQRKLDRGRVSRGQEAPSMSLTARSLRMRRRALRTWPEE